MTEPPANEPRLESWGEIAAHLRRDVRTVQRWERYHGLPVRRLQVGKLATVYAYRSELDKWFLEHQPKPEAEDPHDEPTTGEDVSAELAAFAPGEEPGDSSHPKSFGLGKILLAGLILLGVAGGIYSLLHYKPLLPGRAAEKTRLFVRPFANHSGDPKQDEFTEGLTDEINTQLGKIAPLRLGVIAPTSSKILASKSIDELRRDLSVQYVLEGSVRRGLNQVRIDIQLISASDQTPVWSDSFTNDLNDILLAQDEVAAAVAKKILVTFPAPATETSSAASPASAKQIDPEAFDAYLAGRRFSRKNPITCPPAPVSPAPTSFSARPQTMAYLPRNLRRKPAKKPAALCLPIRPMWKLNAFLPISPRAMTGTMLLPSAAIREPWPWSPTTPWLTSGTRNI